MNEKEQSTDIRVHSPLLTRLENFWYHYKWHTCIALFLVVVLAVCLGQLSKKQQYDVYVLYAADHDVARTSAAGGVSEYDNLVAGFKRIAHDKNGNGEREVMLQHLFMMTNEQIREYNQSNPDNEVNVRVVKDNESILTSNLLYSDYYICLLSPEVYLAYGKTAGGVSLFAPIDEYAPECTAARYDDYAVRLADTKFGTLPGFADLPQDTLVCLRILSEIANTKKNQPVYESAKTTMRALLLYP